MKVPVYRISLLIAATGGVVWLSVTGEPPVPKWQMPHLDKLLHALEFLILSILAYNAFRGFSFGSFWVRSSFVLALGYGIFWGGVTEWLQFFTAARTPSAADALADWGGALLGAGLARAFWGKKLNAASS